VRAVSAILFCRLTRFRNADRACLRIGGPPVKGSKPRAGTAKTWFTALKTFLAALNGEVDANVTDIARIISSP
jgi:hypothetical protein